MSALEANRVSATRDVQYGLIAEEVALVFPELVVRDGEGRPETIQYHELVPMLVNELQKLRDEMSALRRRRDRAERR